MSDPARQDKTHARHGGGTTAKPRVSNEMSSTDHTRFVDLMLQQTAQSAIAAQHAAGEDAQLRAAAQAVSRARAAIAGLDVPATGMVAKRLFGSLDVAFFELNKLERELYKKPETTLSLYADEVKDVMDALGTRFQPLGWRRPQAPYEMTARAKTAKVHGAAIVTPGEARKLGRLHISAARQHLIARWSKIAQGNLDAADLAAHELRDAMKLLVDPHNAGEMAAAAVEVATMGELMDRVVATIQENAPTKLAELAELARQLDRLRQLVGRPPRWVAKITSAPPARGHDGPGKARPMRPGPDAQQQPDTRTNDGLRSTRTWKKRVHLKDTNYINDYLGYVELLFTAREAESGSIDMTAMRIISHLEGRAVDYLEIVQTELSHRPDNDGGKPFCEVIFGFKVQSPKTVRTTSESFGAKVSVGGDHGGGEVTAGSSTGRSVPSTGGGNEVRRVFVVSTLPVPLHTFEPDMHNQLAPVEIRLRADEDLRAREDFEDWEIDDQDVGGGVFDANWVLHSYSE